MLSVVAAPLIVIACTFPSAPALIEVPGAQLTKLSDGQIRYEDEGAGPNAVLFLHGFNGQLGYWNPTWQALGDCGRRVRIDIPGFGGSRFDLPSYELESQARRIIEFLDQRAIRKVTIVAESMGGSLAAVLAARFPDRVSALALLAPSGYTGALHYSGLYGRLLKPGKLKSAATWLAGSRLYKALFPMSEALPGLTVTDSYGPTWVNVLPLVQAPTLIVWSKGDLDVSYTTAPDVAREIRGSELLRLDERTGHLISHERPQLIAGLACRLAHGESPAQLAASPLRDQLRDGEGFDRTL